MVNSLNKKMFYDTLECWVELFGSGSPSQIYLPEKIYNSKATHNSI